MKGSLVVLAVLVALWLASVELPNRLIGIGLEDFEGRERRLASRALLDISSGYGNGFLEIGDYTGPPLVLGWHVTSVEECPDPPPGKRVERDSIRAYVGGRATVGADSLFGIPRGEMEVTCSGQRKWEPYF